jgi:hypothetical protein
MEPEDEIPSNPPPPVVEAPGYLNCPVAPDANYYLTLIASQFEELAERNGLLCLSYKNTPQGARYEYRVALRAAHYMFVFLQKATAGVPGVGGEILQVDPSIVKSFKEGDIQITYRDNAILQGQRPIAPGEATNPYERELMELEADLLGTRVGVDIIL